MFGRYNRDDLKRPFLLFAGVASAATALASLQGRHPAMLPFVVTLVIVSLLACVTALLAHHAIVPMASLALLLTAVAGRWSEAGASRSLAYGLVLSWSVVIVLFAGRKVTGLAVGGVALALVAPLWWYGVSGLAAAVAHASVAAFLLGPVVAARARLVYATQTVSAVFEHAPLGIMEQNWGDTLDELEKLRRAGVTDVESYLRANPGEAGRLFATARVVAANDQAARVFPTPGPDGRHSPDIIGDAMFEDTVTLMVDLFEGRYDRTVVWPMPDDEGVLRWHQVTGFRHPGGKADIIVVATDITDVKKAEEALEQLVATKDRFVAAISHELRTPLAAVVGFTSELLEGWDDLEDAYRHEFLSIANQQAMEATNIISDLLVAARADIGGVTVTHGPVELGHEIEQTLVANGWNVPVCGVEGLPTVCADGGRVRQILRNLLTNAVRYGGLSERIVCSGGPDTVSVEVRDDGPELSQGELESLFGPYVRAHESAGITESVGLGLTVARHLAMIMGGSLVAFRDAGETVFRLTLPMVGVCPAVHRSAGKSVRTPSAG
jgi:signal transduction histidine kinase